MYDDERNLSILFSKHDTMSHYVIVSDNSAF